VRTAGGSGWHTDRLRLLGGGAIVLAIVAVLADPIGDAARYLRARIAPLPPHEPFVVAVEDPLAPGDRRAAAQVRRRIGRAPGLQVRADVAAPAGRLLLDASGGAARLRAAPPDGFEGAFGSRELLEAELALPDGIGRAHRGAVAALALASVAPATGAEARHQAARLRDATRALDAARTDGRLSTTARADAAAAHPIAAAVLAELTGDVRAMRVAAEGFHRAAASRAATPRDRGIARHDLGVVLAALGARDSGAALLHEAVASHRAALLDRRRDAAPNEWAATQHALGRALATLALREVGEGAAGQAIDYAPQGYWARRGKDGRLPASNEGDDFAQGLTGRNTTK
jgi:hypothetical protein